MYIENWERCVPLCRKQRSPCRLALQACSGLSGPLQLLLLLLPLV